MPRDFVIVCGDFVLECTPSGLPAIYDELKKHAMLTDESGLNERDLCCLSVRRTAETWPFLIVALGCPTAAAGLSPGALLALDAGTLFIGYGERLLAYRLLPPAKLWTSGASGGFLFWEQHGEVVLLGAGRALAAWSSAAEKLWTAPVAQDWSHEISGESIELTGEDGRKRRFSLREGPR